MEKKAYMLTDKEMRALATCAVMVIARGMAPPSEIPTILSAITGLNEKAGRMVANVFAPDPEVHNASEGHDAV